MTRARAIVVVVAVTAALAAMSSPAWAQATDPKWVQRIDEVVGDRPFSVVIGNDGEVWYRHLARVARAPASNQKLILSMALFNRFGTDRTIATSLMSKAPVGRILDGDLWIVGRGDPEITPADLAALARQLVDAGVRRIRGAVAGSHRSFARDWWAPGWRDYFPEVFIARPTALVYAKNEDAAGRHVNDPERRAAAALTARLEAMGVVVRDAPTSGVPPTRMRVLAQVRSAPLEGMVRRMNRDSRNLWAEVLGKFLGTHISGTGSIAAAAAAVCAYAAARGEALTCRDASGLSYDNRASPLAIVRLLWDADTRQWGPALRISLPTGDQGTLEDRLIDVKIRAKTGTLIDHSALSGWIWLQRSDEWAEFSIISSGFDDASAKIIENKIVRAVSANASDPTP